MKNKQGLLFVLSGPSGCGKGTVVRELLNQNEDIFLSISATTRLPRDGEVDGQHYYFLTKEQFEEQIATDGMLEHASYCGNYYGTPKDAVMNMCRSGKDVILEIEVQGALQIKKKHPDAVLIFILPPSLEELSRRLIDRHTEDMETINKRLAKSTEEIRHAKEYDYTVVNDTVLETVEQIESIMEAEKFRSKRMLPMIDDLFSTK